MSWVGEVNRVNVIQFFFFFPEIFFFLSVCELAGAGLAPCGEPWDTAAAGQAQLLWGATPVLGWGYLAWAPSVGLCSQ